jgi:hypothetical protein
MYDALLATLPAVPTQEGLLFTGKSPHSAPRRPSAAQPMIRATHDMRSDPPPVKHVRARCEPVIP